MRHSKSSLFLMELIIVILFFSLASAVCIRLFAQSHIISRDTVDQNHAVTQAQNLAELWYAASGDLLLVREAMPDSVLHDTGNGFSLYFDSEWNPLDRTTGPDSFVYLARLTTAPAAQEGLLHANIQIWKKVSGSSAEAPKELFSLDLTQHIADRRGKH